MDLSVKIICPNEYQYESESEEILFWNLFHFNFCVNDIRICLPAHYLSVRSGPATVLSHKCDIPSLLKDNPISGVATANQTKEGQFMNFSQGHSGTKVQCESCLFS